MTVQMFDGEPIKDTAGWWGVVYQGPSLSVAFKSPFAHPGRAEAVADATRGLELNNKAWKTR